MGDTIGANFFIVGYALQKGLLPLTEEALHAAIDLNGVAPDFNKRALLWGRRAAHDLSAVRAVLENASHRASPEPEQPDDDLDNFIQRRAADLTAYQNAAYARAYTDVLDTIAKAEDAAVPGATELTDAAARALFKTMAIKDEYEVARLYTDGRFEQAVREQFEDGAELTFHLAPPVFAERDPNTGRLRKKDYGAWAFKAFRLLAGLKGLRGTPVDLFGWSAERRLERTHRDAFADTLRMLAKNLSAANHEIAVDIARLPLSVRGFGHVWQKNHDLAATREKALLASFENAGTAQAAAE